MGGPLKYLLLGGGNGSGGIPSGTQGQLVGYGSGGTPTAITPDTAPTAGSSNPVTSGGVYQAILEAEIGVELTGEQWDAINSGVTKSFVQGVDLALFAKDKIKTWADMQAAVRAGLIGKILDPGDQLSVDHNETLTVSVSGTGVTEATVDADVFLSKAGTQKDIYVFSYVGSKWYYDSKAVTLSDYGITPTGTAVAGDEIAVMRTATAYDFDTQGIDEDEAVDPTIDHVLSIQMHKVFDTVVFDPPQYLFAVTPEACAYYGWPATGMPAGTYNITLDHGAYNGGTTQDGTFQFTTTEIVPVGGGIRHSQMGLYRSDNAYTKENLLAGTWTTYAADTCTTIETGIATVEGSEGTSLGTTTASNPQYKSGDYNNFTQRNGHGSNRWSTSFMRQYLNSRTNPMTWTPATIWSRRPATLPRGYLHRLDPELVAVLCKVRTRYALPVADGYGYEDVEDYVKLDTMLDIFGQKNNNISEGPVDASGNVTRTAAYSLWKTQNTNAQRVKYKGSSASGWWLASANPSGTLKRYVNSSGALNDYGAYSASGVVPSLYIG